MFNRVYRLEIQSVSHVGIFDPSCELEGLSNLLTGSPGETGGGGEVRVVWRASTGVIHCVSDQIPNLQNCFAAPNKDLGGEGASDR